MFSFGQRAAYIAAGNEPMLTALLAAGADLNLKSDWQNGPFMVLDRAHEGIARFLLRRGALLTPNVAARLGWLDELQALVRPTRHWCMRSAVTASSHSTRPRASQSPTTSWIEARTSTRAASTTSPRRPSTRWSIASRSAGVCSNAARCPTSSWPPGSATSA
jgi:hypothetical protein